jgi:hypothetical protein
MVVVLVVGSGRVRVGEAWMVRTIALRTIRRRMRGSVYLFLCGGLGMGEGGGGGGTHG